MASRSRLSTLKVVGLAIFALVLVADLWSKDYMQELTGLEPGPDQVRGTHQEIVFEGWFNLAWQGTWNPGVTWGLLPGQTNVILILTGLATLALFVWFLGTKLPSKSLHVGLALILSGAVGNLYDRMQWDKVRDFILLYSGDIDNPDTWGLFGVKIWPWPNFNVADAGIVCGVILVLFDALWGLGAKEAKARHEAKKAEKAAASDRAGA